MSWFCNLCTTRENNQIILSNYSLSRNSSIDLKPNNKPGKHRSLFALSNNFYEEANKNQQKMKSSTQNIYPNKSPFICIFCNGKKCKSEDYRIHPNPAIPGLNSDLYFNSIYASQRPSNVLIKKFNLISFFKANDIKLIINLQVPGEHPFCGPNEGLDKSSGFSYSPALFISEGIKVKLCGWNDLEPPSNYDIMLDIVKEMAFAINSEKKKVFVHCHAGNGRTGLVIACYLLYTDPKMTAESAIKIVREKRRKGVEKKSQEEFCNNFELFIQKKRKLFTSSKKDICTIIKNQIDLYYLSNNYQYNSIILNTFLSNDSNVDNPMINFTYIPKIIYTCLDRIIALKLTNKILDSDIYKAVGGAIEINEMTYNSISIIIEHINHSDYSLLEQSESIVIVSEILFIWLNENVISVINPTKIRKIFTQPLPNNNHNKNVILTVGNVIDNFKIESESHINESLSFLVSTLSKTEYETLKYISQFLYRIYPLNTNNQSLVSEYKLMLQKLVIFILGFNLDYFIDIETGNELEKRIVEETVSLIEFFLFYKKNDDKSNGGPCTNTKSVFEIEDGNIINEEDIDDKKLYEVYLNLKKKFEKGETAINNNKRIVEDCFFTRKLVSNLKRNSCLSMTYNASNNNSSVVGTPKRRKEGSGVVSFAKNDKYYCG